MLCDPMDRSTPGLPVHHQLLELAQTHVVMSSNHLILCHPLILLSSIFPSIRVFSRESALHIRWPKFWSFSFSLSPPNEYSGLVSFRTDWFDLLAVPGTLESLSSMTTYMWEWPNIYISYTLQCHRGQRQRKSVSIICLNLTMKLLSEIRNPNVRVREGSGTPLQYSCLENSTGGGVWWAAVHGVAKSRTRLSDFTFIFHFHALEKEMATHSSVLAWRIPGTGEPGGLPSMGSHRVRHDWSDLAAAAAAVWE